MYVNSHKYDLYFNLKNRNFIQIYLFIIKHIKSKWSRQYLENRLQSNNRIYSLFDCLKQQFMHLVSKLNKKIVFNHRAVFSCTRAEYQLDYTDPKSFFDYSTFGIPEFTRYHMIRFPISENSISIDFWIIVQKLLIMSINNKKVILDVYLPYIFEGKNYEGRYIIYNGQLLGIRLNTMTSVKKFSKWPRKKTLYQKFQHSENIFLQNRRNDYIVGEFSIKMMNLRIGLIFKEEVEYCIYEYSLYEYEIMVGEVDRGFSHFVVDPSDACFKIMKKLLKIEPIQIDGENIMQFQYKKTVLQYHIDLRNNRLFHRYSTPNFSEKQLIHQLQISSIMNSKLEKKSLPEVQDMGNFQLIALFYENYNEQHHNTIEFLKILEQMQNRQRIQLKAKKQKRKLEKMAKEKINNKDATDNDIDDQDVLITDGNQFNPAYVHKQALEIIDKTRKYLKTGLKCHKCQIVYEKKAMCICQVKQCQNTFCKKCLIEDYQWNILAPQMNSSSKKPLQIKRNSKKIVTFANDGLDYISNCPICYQKCQCQICKDYQKKLSNMPISSNKQKLLCHYCKKVSIISIECWNQECRRSFCYTCCSQIFEQPQVGKAVNKQWVCYVCREKCPCSDCIKKQKLKVRESQTGLELLGALSETQKKFLQFLREGKDPQNQTKENQKNIIKKQPEQKKKYEKRPWQNKKNNNNNSYKYQPKYNKNNNQENHFYTKRQVKVQRDIAIKEKIDTNENVNKGLWGKKNGNKDKQWNKNKQTKKNQQKNLNQEPVTSNMAYIIPAENQLNNFSNDFEY